MESIDNKISVKIVPLENWHEYHITLKNIGVAGRSFESLLLNLEKEKIFVTKIIFFGNLRKIKKLLPAVRGKFPFLIVGNSLPERIAGKNVSVYINGIKILNGQSQKFMVGGEIVGNYFDFSDFTYLNVPGVYLKNKKTDFRKEAEAEYAKIAKILAQYGFEAKDIYRFWNYMGRIWKNYPAFNAARNAYFAKSKIIKFPAATGIEAKLGFGKKISLGFEAIKPKKNIKFKWEVVKSDVQCEASSYDRQVSGMLQGPKFSRAVQVAFPGEGTVKFYISGTSSAGKKGESSLQGDLAGNVAYTMFSFAHLLGKSGLNLDDVVSAHVYFKNKKTFQAFEKLYVSKKWNFPYNPVFTNICRRDFFFEIEGIAADKHEDYLF